MTDGHHTHALSLGVSIPVLNDRDGVEQVLRQIGTALDGVGYTICIVDDGSRDGTVGLIQDLMSRDDRIHLIRRVKARSGCQRGAASRATLEWLVAHTTHSVFVEMDADGAHRPAELLEGARQVALLGYDVAIASKYVDGSRVIGRPLNRRLISRFYCGLARRLLDRRIRDYSNSYRFYSRPAAELLLAFKPTYTSPVYLLEILATWIANDCRIIEIPTVYVERVHGRSKVTCGDLIEGLLGTLDIARRFHRNELSGRGFRVADSTSGLRLTSREVLMDRAGKA